MNAGWAFERGRDAAASPPAMAADRDEADQPPSVVRIEQRRRTEAPPVGRSR